MNRLESPVRVLATSLSISYLANSDLSSDVVAPLLRAMESLFEPGSDAMPMQFSSDGSSISAYWDPAERIVMVYTNTNHPQVNPMEPDLYRELLPHCIPLSLL